MHLGHLARVRLGIAQGECRDLTHEGADEAGDGQRDDLDDSETDARQRPPDRHAKAGDGLGGRGGTALTETDAGDVEA